MLSRRGIIQSRETGPQTPNKSTCVMVLSIEVCLHEEMVLQQEQVSMGALLIWQCGVVWWCAKSKLIGNKVCDVHFPLSGSRLKATPYYVVGKMYG